MRMSGSWGLNAYFGKITPYMGILPLQDGRAPAGRAFTAGITGILLLRVPENISKKIACRFFKKFCGGNHSKKSGIKILPGHFPVKKLSRTKSGADFPGVSGPIPKSGYFVSRCFFIRAGFTKHCVITMTAKPDPLRVAAAVILGVITGAILFLIIAIVIGMINDISHMNIPISMLVAENVFSAVLLVVLVIVCVAAFYRKVITTPPSEPVADEPATED
ncbi:MAG: hypothetical protein A4E35_00093 [Methanoregula sp. PtaU1.Bin051]|nr:MAG: hypothetical protein A4E35_00093 [Methanoregula sp. PtaU1.Bin051]